MQNTELLVHLLHFRRMRWWIVRFPAVAGFYDDQSFLHGQGPSYLDLERVQVYLH